MARMRPQFVSEHTRSRAEVDMFAIIERELSDDWTALHSLGLAIHPRKPWAEADFVLIGPPGVFVLEVKGKRVRRENGMWIFTSGAGVDSQPKAEGPFDQAGGAAAALYTYLAARLRFMRTSVVGYGVLTPDVRFSVEGPDIIAALVYDAEDVGAEFSKYMKRLGDHWRARIREMKRTDVAPLGLREREAVAELLRGDFDGRLSLRSRADRVVKDILRLTTEQYRVLDGLAANERAIVSGAAGTGKTLLAVEEAARHMRRDKKVLLACFNRPLADFLGRVTADLPSVRATSMHAYLSDLVRRAGMEDELGDASGSRLFDVVYPDVAYQALLEERVSDQFDVLIVDEAQDLLAPQYMDVFDAVLKGGISGGTWRMFYDPRQDIFDVSDAATLRRLKSYAASYTLTTNCRNTRPIGITTGMICGFEPGETLSVGGPDVTVRWYRDVGEHRRLLERDLNRLLSGGFRPQDLVILGRRKLRNTSLAGGLAAVPFVIVEAGSLASTESHLTFSTVHAFKGLEADVVLLVDIDDLASDDAVAALYVGSSRARVELYLYLSESVRSQYEQRARDLGSALARQHEDPRRVPPSH